MATILVIPAGLRTLKHVHFYSPLAIQSSTDPRRAHGASDRRNEPADCVQPGSLRRLQGGASFATATLIGCSAAPIQRLQNDGRRQLQCRLGP